MADICGLLVAELRLGLPGEKDDIFAKLEEASVLSLSTVDTSKRTRGLRNIPVHGYMQADDRIVHSMALTHLTDLDTFFSEVLRYIRHPQPLLWWLWESRLLRSRGLGLNGAYGLA